MSKRYTLDRISKMFNVPKSTLRYWESEGLIPSKRNDDNNYREYTYEDIIIICDILFYRSLNVPIKKLKHLYDVSLYENITYLKQSNQNLENEIERIRGIQENIKRRIHHYDTFMESLNGHFPYQEPYFDQIVHMKLTEGKNLENYLSDQSVLALCLKPNENPLTIFGAIPHTHVEKDILWEKNQHFSYKPCLIEVKEEVVHWDLLNPYINELKNNNYHIHNIIMSYLLADHSTDYYLGWIEYE